MNITLLLAGAVAALMLIYLIVSLIKPEWFE